MRAQNRPEPPGIQRARGFARDTFQDTHGAGNGYNSHDLAELFRAVTGNPRITTAKLQNLLAGTEASGPVRALADGLPASHLVAANIGEYAASASAWQHLLRKIEDPACILGHLYVSETNLSGLSESLKKRMIHALGENRTKQGYLARTDTRAKRDRVRSARCWWNPRR